MKSIISYVHLIYILNIVLDVPNAAELCYTEENKKKKRNLKQVIELMIARCDLHSSICAKKLKTLEICTMSGLFKKKTSNMKLYIKLVCHRAQYAIHLIHTCPTIGITVVSMLFFSFIHMRPYAAHMQHLI